ncbi:MAG: DUF2938 domain-containing protein [Anaerolineales bacterium]|uniref:DUF2938 domain-containing protein n=1 Tax=Promineifilum sp. TaxID=2664178 RepID=UPI001D347849|nr:DUF2938 domain-containing protein [Anaerolineales bacterium]MCO5181552.1 DUF2938 domain-containing protein [Promineifilum sp.]
MNDLALLFSSAIVMGLGATLTFDLWGQLLKVAFHITPSDICLIGRWLRTMPEGTFRHSNIAAAPQKRAECAVGWIAHYLIGITFAVVFVALAGESWLRQPTPLPALAYGIVTVLAPFAIMQPLFGLGFAASKTANPTAARLRSLMNHAAFGAGLYLFAWLVNWLAGALD